MTFKKNQNQFFGKSKCLLHFITKTMEQTMQNFFQHQILLLPVYNEANMHTMLCIAKSNPKIIENERISGFEHKSKCIITTFTIYHSIFQQSLRIKTQKPNIPSHCSEKISFNGHCMNLTWLVKIHFHCKIHKNFEFTSTHKIIILTLSNLISPIIYHLSYTSIILTNTYST